MDFPERLKQLRKEAGLSQKQLAKKIGISTISIEDYEQDRRQPNVFNLCCLADFFHASTDYLLGRTDKK